MENKTIELEREIKELKQKVKSLEKEIKSLNDDMAFEQAVHETTVQELYHAKELLWQLEDDANVYSTFDYDDVDEMQWDD